LEFKGFEKYPLGKRLLNVCQTNNLFPRAHLCSVNNLTYEQH